MTGEGLNFHVLISSRERGAAILENTGGSWTKYSTSPIYKIKVFLVNYQETDYSVSVGAAVFHQNEVRGRKLGP